MNEPEWRYYCSYKDIFTCSYWSVGVGDILCAERYLSVMSNGLWTVITEFDPWCLYMQMSGCSLAHETLSGRWCTESSRVCDCNVASLITSKCGDCVIECCKWWFWMVDHTAAIMWSNGVSDNSICECLLIWWMTCSAVHWSGVVPCSQCVSCRTVFLGLIGDDCYTNCSVRMTDNMKHM